MSIICIYRAFISMSSFCCDYFVVNYLDPLQTQNKVLERKKMCNMFEEISIFLSISNSFLYHGVISFTIFLIFSIQTRNAYDFWQQQDRMRISELINKFWYFALPSPASSMCKPSYWESMHEEYTDLMHKLIR